MARIIVDGIKLEGPAAREVVRAAMKAARKSSPSRGWGPLLLMLLTSAVVCGIASWLFAIATRTWFGGVLPAATGVFSAFLGSIIGMLWMRQYMKFHRREMRRAMRDHGYELCPDCGYWLRGLPEDSPRCPECGAEREEGQL